MTQYVRGLESTVQLVRLHLGWLHEHQTIRRELGVSHTAGVLLHGPAGCGKTLLVKALATEFRASLHTIVASSVFDAVTGQSEERLRDAFKRAQEEAAERPVILFLDEVDALCPKRVTGEEHEKRVAAQLLTLLDGVCQHSGTGRRLFVIAASNRPEAIDPALRRAGRLDREIYIPLPTEKAREAILALHTSAMPLAVHCKLADIAVASNGFSSSDLVALSREAGIAALARRTLPAQNPNGLELEPEAIHYSDFVSALERVHPSIMRSSAHKYRKVSWNDIGGVIAAKERIIKGVVWPIRHGDALERLGLKPPQGVIIEGPSGCGKTILMEAAITASGVSCQMLTAAELYSSFVGEGEAILRAAFATARSTAPSIILIDEMDTIAGRRTDGDGVGPNQLLTTLLTEIDGLENAAGVLVLAATNNLEAIDPALLRPGRFDVHITVGRPDADGRLAILKIHCQKYILAADVDLKGIAMMMNGFSGADIECICREAGLTAMHEQLQNRMHDSDEQHPTIISALHFKNALLSCNTLGGQT